MEVNRLREFWKDFTLTTGHEFHPVRVVEVHHWQSRVLGILVLFSDMFGMQRREAFLVFDAQDPYSDVSLKVSVNEATSSIGELSNYMDESGSDLLQKLSGIVLFDPSTMVESPIIREIDKDTQFEVQYMHGEHFERVLNQFGALYDKFGSNMGAQLEQERLRAAELKRQLTRSEENLRALTDEYSRFASRDFRLRQIQAWRDHYSMDAVHQVGNEISQLSLPLRKARSLAEDNEAVQIELKKVSAAQVQMERLISRLLARGVGSEFSKTSPTMSQFIAKSETRCDDKQVSFSSSDFFSEKQDLTIFIDLDGFLRVISELAENSTYWTNSIQVTPNIEMRLEHATSVNGYNEVQFIWRDNGPGVEDEDKELIFLPTKSGRLEGTGTGLVFVRRFFEAHGGEVVECGDYGHGIKFIGRIPLGDIG